MEAGTAYPFPQNLKFEQSPGSLLSVDLIKMSADNHCADPLSGLPHVEHRVSRPTVMAAWSMSPLKRAKGLLQAPLAIKYGSVEFLNASGM